MKKSMMLYSLAALAITACTPPEGYDGVSTNESSAEESGSRSDAAEREAPVAEPEIKATAFELPSELGPPAAFDGTRIDKKSFDPAIATYTIDLVLESSRDNEFGALTSTSPAMPFLSNAGTAYLTDEGYLLSGDIFGDVEINCDPFGANRIAIINASDGAAIVHNGNIVWRGERIRRLSEITFGSGYQDRVWKGEAAIARVSGIPIDAKLNDVLMANDASHQELFAAR